MAKNKKYDQILIAKASGELVPFSEEKLRRSLERSGANEVTIGHILSQVKMILHPDMSTKEIYRKAYAMLRKSASPTAARYKLKKAIMELGPSGYPFERYVGEILKHEGFHVQVGQIVQGHCVQHEVDVIAEKERRHFMIECKFHSDQKRKCDVKTPLYIHSRFLDVERAWKKRPGHATKFHQGWLVTNTRFSEDAIQYGTCVGLNLVSWDFPRKDSLKDRIDRSGLHPLTCLTTLTKREKQMLLERDIVLCKELCHHEQWLKEIGIPPNRARKVMQEAGLLCETKIKL